MENSDSDDEESEPAAPYRLQMRRSVPKEAFDPSVRNRGEEDAKLRRRQYLLGNASQGAEEGSQQRLRGFTEPSPRQDSGGQDPSAEVSPCDSPDDWFRSFEQPANVMRTRQRGQESYGIVSQNKPNQDDSRLRLERNFTPSGSLDTLNEYAPSSRYSMGVCMGNNTQWQVHNSLPESTSWCHLLEQYTPLTELQPTRGQKRSRSSSPDHQRAGFRADGDSTPLNRMSVVSQGSSHVPLPQTPEHPPFPDSEVASRPQHQGILCEPRSGNELQSGGLLTTYRPWIATQGESSSGPIINEEPWRLEERNPTRLLDFEVHRVYPEAQWDGGSIAREAPITAPTSGYLVPHEDGGGRWCEHQGLRSYGSSMRGTINRTSNTGLSGTESSATQSTFPQPGPVFDESSNLMHTVPILEPMYLMNTVPTLGPSYFIWSESFLEPGDLVHAEPSDPASRDNIEQTDNESSHNSEHNILSGSHSNHSFHNSPYVSIAPRSSSSSITTLSSCTMSSLSSDSEISESSSEVFENGNEGSVSSESLSEFIQERQAWFLWPFPELAHFIHPNEGDEEQPIGLTKDQIDNLEVRSFTENDATKSCSVCITQYTEGSQLRVLPCSHEYHAHCIDRWLAENLTCPICRRNVIDSGDR